MLVYQRVMALISMNRAHWSGVLCFCFVEIGIAMVLYRVLYKINRDSGMTTAIYKYHTKRSK